MQSDQLNKEDTLLFQLVMMFHSSALQALGKIKNPVTQKEEKDLEQAQFSIDMIDMLQRKTKQNIAKEIDDFITQVLMELRMEFIKTKEQK